MIEITPLNLVFKWIPLFIVAWIVVDGIFAFLEGFFGAMFADIKRWWETRS